jgi:branched-chain amino acid transport system permease protein
MNAMLDSTKQGSTLPKAPRCAPAWRSTVLVLVIGSAACYALPEQLGLLARIFVTALLVLSLDLVVGVAGLATLGHAAMFGIGAYAAKFCITCCARPLDWAGYRNGIGCSAGISFRLVFTAL